MNQITSGNLIVANFQKVDPTMVLDKKSLETFYETIEELERKSKVTTKEWNDLINYIQQFNQQFSVTRANDTVYKYVIN